METHKMLVTSTAHLPRSEVELLEASVPDTYSELAPQFGFTMAAYREGFVVSCTGVEDQPESASLMRLAEPPTLHRLRLTAKQLGYTYLMLDADAEPLPGLETHDW